jgi:hypothetical protein
MEELDRPGHLLRRRGKAGREVGVGAGFEDVGDGIVVKFLEGGGAGPGGERNGWGSCWRGRAGGHGCVFGHC